MIILANQTGQTTVLAKVLFVHFAKTSCRNNQYLLYLAEIYLQHVWPYLALARAMD